MKIKAVNLNKLCSKFEVVITKNELSEIFSLGAAPNVSTRWNALAIFCVHIASPKTFTKCCTIPMKYKKLLKKQNIKFFGQKWPKSTSVSPLSCVCHVFPPLVSIFGLFPVLVKCHYDLILVQPCLSNYLWFTCVFIVLSVQFDFVWSTRYFPGVSCPCKSCLVLPWCLH